MGLPASIRVDQGTEFVSRDLDLLAYQRGVTLGQACAVVQSDRDVPGVEDMLVEPHTDVVVEAEGARDVQDLVARGAAAGRAEPLGSRSR